MAKFNKNRCAIVGCRNQINSGRPIILYDLPIVPITTTTTANIGVANERKKRRNKLRRKSWLDRISLHANISPDIFDDECAEVKICSTHFQLGKPADLNDYTNPDWLPNIFPTYDNDIKDLHPVRIVANLHSDEQAHQCEEQTSLREDRVSEYSSEEDTKPFIKIDPVDDVELEVDIALENMDVLRLQRPFKDEEVMLLVNEYMQMYERFQRLKILSRINVDLLSLVVDCKHFPGVKEEVEKVQNLVNAVLNEKEIYSIEIIDSGRDERARNVMEMLSQDTLAKNNGVISDSCVHCGGINNPSIRKEKQLSVWPHTSTQGDRGTLQQRTSKELGGMGCLSKAQSHPAKHISSSSALLACLTGKDPEKSHLSGTCYQAPRVEVPRNAGMDNRTGGSAGVFSKLLEMQAKDTQPFFQVPDTSLSLLGRKPPGNISKFDIVEGLGDAGRDNCKQEPSAAEVLSKLGKMQGAEVANKDKVALDNLKTVGVMLSDKATEDTRKRPANEPDAANEVKKKVRRLDLDEDADTSDRTPKPQASAAGKLEAIVHSLASHKPQSASATGESYGSAFKERFELDNYLKGLGFQDEYTCKFCSNQFPKKGSLAHHLELVHLENQLHNCRICGLGFALKPFLVSHLQLMHPGMKNEYSGKHRCIKCGKAFKRDLTLQFHMMTHSNKENSEGSRAGSGEDVDHEQQVKKHDESHSEAEEIKCSEGGSQDAVIKEEENSSDSIDCVVSFQSKEEVNDGDESIIEFKNQTNVKNRIENPSDSVSDTGSDSESDAESETEIQNGPEKQTIEIPSECDLTFMNKLKAISNDAAALSETVKTGNAEKLPLDKKSCHCRICGIAFKGVAAMRHHLASHATPRKKAASLEEIVAKERNSCYCTQCDRTFRSELERNEHVKSHGIRQFFESIEKIDRNYFVTTGNAQNYLDQEDTREANVECTDCGRKFMSEKELREHIDLLQCVFLMRRRWLCSMCGAEFNAESSYTTHMKFHDEFEKKRAQRCPVCGKEFPLLKYLKKHMQLQHGQKLVGSGAKVAQNKESSSPSASSSQPEEIPNQTGSEKGGKGVSFRGKNSQFFCRLRNK